ncbi:uncharacterized protein LOC112341917 isoform X2 [Selaginella moellendorffii]|uniref:uncharacterized protein LOC112341917 isoform X2 n=1 Tax=Selaginella moellendorffii TaxID=88036 RepID=UPI000D1D04D9|nr:uncharacterized protein LOC112341917 isoform X2 [Selaginella moellendorffii]|eukprot:XP_024518696.1 uncharacterized protein LOC112341917 isoform X2 [Selaginella moellendorffii]
MCNATRGFSAGLRGIVETFLQFSALLHSIVFQWRLQAETRIVHEAEASAELGGDFSGDWNWAGQGVPGKVELAEWRTLRLLSLPSAVGIFPAMLVEERTRTWRLVMFPSDSGIVKLRLFSRRIKSWSVCSLPNDSGMPPTSRLRLRSMKSSDSNLPNSSVQNNGAGELVQRAGNETAQPVVAEIEPLERAQVSKRRWYRRAQVVTVKIQGVKLGEACKLRRNSTNVSVFSKHQRLEASSKPTDLRRNWPGIAAAAPVEEEAPEKD